jgi:hypothetical protein
VLSIDADIACAPNHSKDRVEEQICDEDRTTLARMGWQIRPDVYINGGLMLCNGTPGARRFAAAWHDGWLASSAQTGRYDDQPALNAAIHEAGPQLAVLPHAYNAQLKMEVRVVKAAKVWHFYSSQGDNEPPFTVFDALVAGLMRSESMSRSGVEAALRQSHPWRRTSWLDDVAAADVFRRGAFSDFDRVWFGGDRRRSLYLRARRTLGAWKARASGRSSSSIQSPSP